MESLTLAAVIDHPISVSKLLSAFVATDQIPKSFMEQCLLVLARALTASKEVDVLRPIFKSINHGARHHWRNSVHSLDNAFGRMRRAVFVAVEKNRQHPVWQLALRELNVSVAQRRLLREECQRRIESANNHVFQFEEDKIKDLLHKLATDSDSDEHDSILLLMLESGLRMIEVLYMANVQKAEVSTRATCDWICVTQLAKTRHPDRPVTKPLLSMKFEEFERRLAKVREGVTAKSAARASSSTTNSTTTRDRVELHKSITNMYNHAVIKRVHVHLGPYTTHIARKIYGALSYEWYGKLRSKSLNAWLQTVMGHSSISTTLSYSNVTIVKSTLDADRYPERADVAFFAKPGSHPIDLDEMLAKVTDTPARARWLRLLQKSYQLGSDYTVADGGHVAMSVWCALGLMEKSGEHYASCARRAVERPLSEDLTKQIKYVIIYSVELYLDVAVRETQQHNRTPSK